jgi:hypothetical protein
MIYMLGPGIVSSTEDAPTYFVVTPKDKEGRLITDSASQINTRVVDANGKDLGIELRCISDNK